MTSFLLQAPNGVIGSISRPDKAKVEPAMLIAQSSVFAPAFGAPMKYVTGGIAQFTGSEAATAFAGILIREVPSIAGDTGASFNQATPNPVQTQGLLTDGNCSVRCAIGTPTRGGIVYVRVVAASGKFVGDLEATSDGSNNVALTFQQASWACDGVDAFKNAEIRVQV